MNIKFLAVVLMGLSALASCKARHDNSEAKGIIFNKAEPPKMQEGTFLFGGLHDDYGESDLWGKNGPIYPICALRMREGKWEVYYVQRIENAAPSNKYPSPSNGIKNASQKDREDFLRDSVTSGDFTPEKWGTIRYEKNDDANIVSVIQDEYGYCLVDITLKK